MYLQSIELHGFKSFPDKIKLDFGRGMTAVVGPNGSGKSNIGDAVRWVLGEQSTKALRGGKMEDVIFSGTQSRKSVGFAQVTLNISNSDRALPVDSDMVSVSRKLYRSGDSEYLINGAQVRLKDVIELFLDTGLGKDGYSIIGQGKIADIVSSKSGERREIFDEAAGIAKFRYKKAEAERKLSSAEDNILRLRDIISELESRVEPLRIQSEKAQKYLALASERRRLEISFWIKKFGEYRVLLTDIDNRLLLSNSEYESLTQDIDAIEDEINELYLKRQQCAVAVEEYRDRILKIEQENSQSHSDIAVMENDIAHISDLISKTEAEKKAALASEDKLCEEIASNQALLTELKNKSADIADSIKSLENELNELESEAGKLDSQKALSGESLNALYIKKSELVYNISSAESSIEESKKSIDEINQTSSDFNESEQRLESEYAQVNSALNEIEEKISEHTNKINGYTLLFNKKTEQQKNLTQQVNAIEIRERELKQRFQLLSDLERNMEGFAHSVKQIVKAGKNGRLSGVYGSVAQLITVENKYTVAVETALGGALQNIAVENEEAAKRGIRLLKEENAGRATFLPITSVKGSVLSESGLDMQEGYVALGFELVRCDEKFSGIIKSLLGRIAVAEDIDSAAKIAKKFGYKFKIVTLDGQVINAGGSFTGGSVSKSTGVLSRKNEIDAASAELKDLESSHAQLKIKLRSLSEDTKKLELDIESEKEQQSLLSDDKTRCKSELQRISLLKDQLCERRKDSDKLLLNLKEKLSSAIESAQNSRNSLILLEDEIVKAESAVSEAQSRGDSCKSQREAISNRLSEFKISSIEIQKDIEACNADIKRLEDAKIQTAADGLRFDKEIKEYAVKIDSIKIDIEERKQALESTKDTLSLINESIKSEQERSAGYEIKSNEQRALERTKQEEKERVSGELSRLEERKQTVSADADSIVSQLWESYSLTVSEASEQAESIEDMNAAQRKLSELKNKIRALGTVNTDALDEYKEVSERYKFMSGQLSDVLKSKSELEKLISSLTENMKTIFSGCFEKINENFKRIFTELFGGGRGELVLTEPENMLESGIEINVAPPGKVIKSLSLLSGGEQAFVAIAIYFAILKVKPSPFCILDEIEAALDDVNVTRFAQYLRNYTDTTQFIVVTHRRGTMEEADVLYGVTMQEKGVSKILKMDVSETYALDGAN